MTMAADVEILYQPDEVIAFSSSLLQASSHFRESRRPPAQVSKLSRSFPRPHRGKLLLEVNFATVEVRLHTLSRAG